MRRTSVMTLGIVLIFVGIQLNLVERYVLTSRFSSFLSEHATPAPRLQPVPQLATNNTPYNSPYYQASFPNGAPLVNPQLAPYQGAPKIVSPPHWLCWPILFLGTVVFLHGFSMRRD